MEQLLIIKNQQRILFRGHPQKNAVLTRGLSPCANMKHLFIFVFIICSICCHFSCQKTSFVEYRLEKIDSIHISFYGNRNDSYVCIDNQEVIDSLCDIIYNSTTKCVTQFYPKMEITIFANNQKQVFGVSNEYIKGHFSAKSIYNVEEKLKRAYKAQLH